MTPAAREKQENEERVITQNLHTHSTFDDGQNSLEEMALAAKAAGLAAVGFSVHTPMPFESCWTIQPGQMADYFAESRRLKEQLRGEIDIFCGAEWDLYSPERTNGFDYVIGSIHHLPAGDRLGCVDNSAEETEHLLKTCFGNDADAFAEAYFAQYLALAKVDAVDIVGHFDLLTKFDEQRGFFAPASPRFFRAALAAMDALIAAGKIFEINTGAISRGYRTTPYPSQPLLKEICARGGKMTISADAHRAEDIAFQFAEAGALAKACGFTELWQFDGKEFLPTPIGG